MNTMVTFRHIPSSPPLRRFAEQKVEKFKKFLIEPIDIHIVLSVEKIRHIAEITLQSKSFSAHGAEENSDLYTAVDNVIDKIEAQLRKHKGKVKGHKSDIKPVDVLTHPLP
jgi:putative sigma-54 modulation protein